MEQFNYTLSWDECAINNLTELGVACIPYLINENKPFKYANSESYSLSEWNNPRVSRDKFAIRLDRLVLIDWDGYKPDTIGYSKLAEHLGFSEDELLNHCAQWNDENTSFHFLFKLPHNVNINDIKQANNGKWLKGVDIKTGNQLCYLKSDKHHRFDIPFATVPSVVITDALKKHESSGEVIAGITKPDLELETALSLISSSCDYQTWTNVIAGTVSKYGSSEEVINILDRWSSTADNYQNRADVETKVNSFTREGGITWGTVVSFAGGHEAIRENLIHCFSNVVLPFPSNLGPMPPFNPVKPLAANDAAILETFGYPDTKLTRSGRKTLSTAENLKTLLKSMGYTVGINSMNLNMDVQFNGNMISPSYEKLRSDLIGQAEKTGLPKVAIEEHLSAIAEAASYHPIQAFFTGKQWDGVPRVQAVIDCLPVNDIDVRNLVMRKWFISAIAAVYEDRFSSKLTPVLRGSQSAMKSAFISRLSSILPDSFLPESTLNPDDVDSVVRVCRHHIVELAELERTTKREAGALKAFLTSPEDNFRMKYGRSDTKKPRQTVFIATVNEAEFLKDTTGNSRFATIELTSSINMDKVNELLGYQWNNGRLKRTEPEKLSQFWLEVKHYYDTGEPWHLTSVEQTRVEAVNDTHVQKGHYYDAILDKLHMFSIGEFTSSRVAEIIGVNASQSRTVGRDLNQLVKDGYLQCRRTSTQRLYTKK
ncbi:VapE domain-containing protein [Vibrio cholerae]|uniref:VapE domain-containing protein n=1 Tax=Vibrio cholerae TaxID=666 RepID=UPI0004E37139|nr:VapE domain-containing protein [Vibrio cholerae]EGQ9389478.1 hypothetical protein [Vibrio cholerae]EGR0538099.1 hypothetical protein [Vibrio cholerae]EGR2309610.1 hypothetical protein [Vibrio cholerae]EGR3953508.1 hypothetical protein [Vibrio cholerae]EGR3989106.1 hypothetical protein [Vibrio cholerae]